MARRRATGGQKAQARKKVTVKLLERQHAGKATTAYQILDRLIAAHHTHLAEAKIAIAWRFGKRADADGRLWLGQCRKGSDLERSLHGYDFVILLNHQVWNASAFTEEQMAALLDHELCHAQVMKDSSGEPKKDEDGRVVYRTRRHDLEEFVDVVARHGLWTSELESFAAAALEARDQPLLAKKTNGRKAKDAQHKAPSPQAAPAAEAVDPLDLPIAELELLPRYERALAEGGINTVRELSEASNSGRLRQISGIGPEALNHIADQSERFWAKYPGHSESRTPAPAKVRLTRFVEVPESALVLSADAELDVVGMEQDNPVVQIYTEETPTGRRFVLPAGTWQVTAWSDEESTQQAAAA